MSPKLKAKGGTTGRAGLTSREALADIPATGGKI
jgi:hypothetical protein